MHHSLEGSCGCQSSTQLGTAALACRMQTTACLRCCRNGACERLQDRPGCRNDQGVTLKVGFQPSSPLDAATSACLAWHPVICGGPKCRPQGRCLSTKKASVPFLMAPRSPTGDRHVHSSVGPPIHLCLFCKSAATADHGKGRALGELFTSDKKCNYNASTLATGADTAWMFCQLNRCCEKKQLDVLAVAAPEHGQGCSKTMVCGSKCSAARLQPQMHSNR